METEKNKPDWNPDDAIANEQKIEFSRKSRDDSIEEVSQMGSGDKEVFIKPDNLETNLPSDRKWSPRKDAFFFSKFVSFL